MYPVFVIQRNTDTANPLLEWKVVEYETKMNVCLCWNEKSARLIAKSLNDQRDEGRFEV